MNENNNNLLDNELLDTSFYESDIETYIIIENVKVKENSIV